MTHDSGDGRSKQHSANIPVKVPWLYQKDGGTVGRKQPRAWVTTLQQPELVRTNWGLLRTAVFSEGCAPLT